MAPWDLVSNNVTNNVSGGICETLLGFTSTLEGEHLGASTFDTILYKISLVNLPMTDAGFYVVYMAILMFEYFLKPFFDLNSYSLYKTLCIERPWFK